jgi:hypothetical protein
MISHKGSHPKETNINNNTITVVNMDTLGKFNKPSATVKKAMNPTESKTPPKAVESIGSKNVSISSMILIYTSLILL